LPSAGTLGGGDGGAARMFSSRFDGSGLSGR
jgi:hypothetical protein